jgi:hypothetical protein
MVSTDTRRTSTAAHFASAIRSHDIIAEVAPLAGGSLRAKTETWAQLLAAGSMAGRRNPSQCA